MNGPGVSKLFFYKPEQARAVLRRVALPLKEHVDAARPLEFVARLLESSALPALKGQQGFEEVYYTLMASRERLPSFFPAHDICLLAANLLPVQKYSTLALLDWELLPAAVLAASPGARITLPPCLGVTEGQEHEAAKIVRTLRQAVPDSGWDDHQYRLEDCVVLGQHPLRHGERDPRFLVNLMDTYGGIFYVSWDFLRVKLHAYTRSLWLRTSLLRGVLQLPRPRRQGATVYPALMELKGAPDREERLRLARIASCGPGPGALDQSFAVSLLADNPPPTNGEVIELPPEVFMLDRLLDLSPAAHLAQQKVAAIPVRKAGDLAKLGDFAQVLRCQLARARIDDEKLHDIQAFADKADRDWWGEYPDGSFIGREVALGELDPVSGFLDQRSGDTIRLHLTLISTQGKYVLQPGDILFAYRGTMASIGQVGFVEEAGIPAITGQALCIIRCLPGLDPVWLYYYLRRQSVREWVCSKAAGSTLLTINLESIRDIPVVLPDKAQLDAINKEHQKIASAMAAVTTLRREIDNSLDKVLEMTDEDARELGLIDDMSDRTAE
jgi:hypothetical protein